MTDASRATCLLNINRITYLPEFCKTQKRREDMELVRSIKQHADRAEKTIDQIEREAGLTVRTIRRWDDHLPSIDKVYRVANVLGCTVDELIREATA